MFDQKSYSNVDARAADFEESQPLGYSYFCNFDELPDVVACSRKSGQTLRSMGYRDLREQIREAVKKEYPYPI